MVNGVVKGKDGEREIVRALNRVLNTVAGELGVSLCEDSLVQRNALQSAIGGRDLVNTWDFAIEVKRSEVLSKNAWWKQTEEQARRVKGVPVLLYRRNRHPWAAMLRAELPHGLTATVEVPFDTFLSLWEYRCREGLQGRATDAPFG